jgi:hypothetical protein
MPFKHTPGEWKVRLFGDAPAIDIAAQNGQWLAKIVHLNDGRTGEAGGFRPTRTEAEGNARLMAEAPAMLAALQQMRFASSNGERTLARQVAVRIIGRIEGDAK